MIKENFDLSIFDAYYVPEAEILEILLFQNRRNIKKKKNRA
jgi:hypothetical protein